MDDEQPGFDLGTQDLPSAECASVSQSTEIDQFPSDVVVVAIGDPMKIIPNDGRPLGEVFLDEFTNLVPYITDGVGVRAQRRASVREVRRRSR